jgi:HlyD family secretion protein
MGQRSRFALAGAIVALATSSACARGGPATLQGYVEGEFVHVASSIGGRLEKLRVQRGETVVAGAALFDLEATQEAAVVRQADETLSAAQAQLADASTGRRRPELAVIQAQLEQAGTAEKQSATQLARDTEQLAVGGIAKTQLESSQARHDVDAARVRELQRQLQVAELAARPEQIRAQTSQVAAAKAALDQTRWKLDEKHVSSASAGVIVDTLYREGEWVPAGSPVVRMLPPGNVKVRFFVPEPLLARFPVGRALSVHCDDCGAPVAATVSYVSPGPEFTPPIIYSNDTRSKLVFMLEARPASDAAPRLRPGQPVEISAP